MLCVKGEGKTTKKKNKGKHQHRQPPQARHPPGQSRGGPGPAARLGQPASGRAQGRRPFSCGPGICFPFVFCSLRSFAAVTGGRSGSARPWVSAAGGGQAPPGRGAGSAARLKASGESNEAPRTERGARSPETPMRGLPGAGENNPAAALADPAASVSVLPLRGSWPAAAGAEAPHEPPARGLPCPGGGRRFAPAPRVVPHSGRDGGRRSRLGRSPGRPRSPPAAPSRSWARIGAQPGGAAQTPGRAGAPARPPGLFPGQNL